VNCADEEPGDTLRKSLKTHWKYDVERYNPSPIGLFERIDRGIKDLFLTFFSQRSSSKILASSDGLPGS